MDQGASSLDKKVQSSLRPPESDVDLTDCLLSHMDISVTESEKRATSALNIRDYYTVYLIETRIKDGGWGLEWKGLGQVWRRYSEFEVLRRKLATTYPWTVLPPLPEKKHTFPAHNAPTTTFDPDFVDRRRAALENFLHRLASHPVISHDPSILMFLQDEEEWKKTMKDSGYVQLAEDKIKNLTVAKIKNPDPKFEVVRKSAVDIREAMGQVLKARAKIASRLNRIHKLHASYGKVFSEWSGIEKDMGDSLQRSGHYFDSISSTISAALEDEEQIVDQLKEYLYYCTSIDELCQRRESLQLQLQQMQQLVNSKNMEKEKLLQGRGGVMSRLFGSAAGTGSEVRAARAEAVDGEVRKAQDAARTQETDLIEFGEKSEMELEKYDKQKEKDLSDTLENFVKLQIKCAKKNLNTWSNIKDCFSSIPR